MNEKAKRKKKGEPAYLEKGSQRVPNPLFRIGMDDPVDDLGQNAPVDQPFY